jgi:hypothetical protein
MNGDVAAVLVPKSLSVYITTILLCCKTVYWVSVAGTCFMSTN